MESRTFCQTVDRALSLLKHFTPQTPQMSIADLCAATGLHKSIVYRLLCTLERHGFVRYDRTTRKYALGLAIIELAEVMREDLQIRDVALPIMRKLVGDIGESAFLTVLRDDEKAVCIERVESPRPIRVTFRRGSVSPLHAGASAKVLMAYLPEKARLRALSRPLTRFTNNTVTDPDELRKELESIRQKGWAFSIGELDEGVYAIAVPILGRSTNHAVASLSIAGPVNRLDRSLIDRVVRLLQEAAKDISSALQVGQDALPRGESLGE